jgi:hypothetical protein
MKSSSTKATRDKVTWLVICRKNRRGKRRRRRSLRKRKKEQNRTETVFRLEERPLVHAPLYSPTAVFMPLHQALPCRLHVKRDDCVLCCVYFFDASFICHGRGPAVSRALNLFSLSLETPEYNSFPPLSINGLVLTDFGQMITGVITRLGSRSNLFIFSFTKDTPELLFKITGK